MKASLWFVTILLGCTLQSTIFGQTKETPNIVSPLIGDTLDLRERDYYHLLPIISGFQAAVFYLHTDSSLDAEVFFIDHGIKWDTLIYHYRTLASFQEYLRRIGKVPTDRSSKDGANRDGANIVLDLRDGQAVEGELLSVRDSSLAIRKSLNDSTIFRSIVAVHYQEIHKIIIKGESKILKDMGLGLLIGAGVGIVIGIASYGSQNHSGEFLDFGPGFYAVAGAGLGGAVGLTFGAIGGVISSSDKEIDLRENNGHSLLMQLSRYPNDEPEYLKQINKSKFEKERDDL